MVAEAITIHTRVLKFNPPIMNTPTITGADDKALSKTQIELVKRTVAVGATDDELAMFMHICKKSGLDPFARQIYFMKRKVKNKDGSWGESATIQTSIDGYRLAAARSNAYAGSEDAVLTESEGLIYPDKSTVTVYRMVENQRCPFTATARWSEYFPGEKQGFMWKKMPVTMLSKCAEALALRKAFPAELSGLYTKEEMEQAEGSPVTHPPVDKLPSVPEKKESVVKKTIDAEKTVTPVASAPTTSTVKPASEKQKALAYILHTKLGKSKVEYAAWVKTAFNKTPEELDGKNISKVIDALNSLVDADAAFVRNNMPDTSPPTEKEINDVGLPPDMDTGFELTQ